MRPIELNLGPHATAMRGAIMDTKDTDVLRDELLEVDLESGYTIAVGWKPHRDPMGNYRLIVFNGSWFRRIHEVTASEPMEAVAKLRWLVELYGKPHSQVELSSSTVERPPEIHDDDDCIAHGQLHAGTR